MDAPDLGAVGQRLMRLDRACANAVPFRPIGRSLIVNYVKPEWRSRRELAYPRTPVG